MNARVFFFFAFAAAAARAQGAPAPTTTTTISDAAAPIVVEVAIAADNPAAAPLVTARVDDDVEVASAVAHWRVEGSAWQETPLQGGGRMLIGRLPDGPQRTGFGVWVEVKDAAGNVARVGSEAEPLDVAAAVEGNADRLAHQAAADTAFRGPHPAWVMLALGTGIAATAGAGVFVYDLNVLSQKTALVDDLLAGDDISDRRRGELESTRTALEKAAVQDQALVATLGVLGGAALATGAVLLTVSALEQ
jgi:hypothetical protein